jgi:hypothetical protein
MGLCWLAEAALPQTAQTKNSTVKIKAAAFISAPI